MGVLRAGNRFVDATQPWKAAKDPAKAGFVRDALYTLAETVRFASAVLTPILPNECPGGAPTTRRKRRRRGRPRPPLRAAMGALVPGTPIAPGGVLFPRIEAAAP